MAKTHVLAGTRMLYKHLSTAYRALLLQLERSTTNKTGFSYIGLSAFSALFLLSSNLFAFSDIKLLPPLEENTSLSRTTPVQLAKNIPLKLLVPPDQTGAKTFKLQSEAPKGWRVNAPKSFSSVSHRHSFVFLVLHPPQNVKAGKYPVKIIIHDENNDSLTLEYEAQVKAIRSLSFTPPVQQGLIEQNKSLPIPIKLKNEGNTVLTLTQSNELSKISGVHWPLTLEPSEEQVVNVTLEKRSFNTNPSGATVAQLKLSLKDKESDLTFHRAFSFNTFSNRNSFFNWKEVPSFFSVIHIFNQTDSDRGISIKGKGPLDAKRTQLIDYELRLRNRYKIKNSRLSGLGYIRYKSKNNYSVEIGDINVQSGSLIQKGARARALTWSKQLSNERSYSAYYSRAWNYQTNQSTDMHQHRIGAKYRQNQENGYWLIEGYQEHDRKLFLSNLTIFSFETKQRLSENQVAILSFARQLHGRVKSENSQIKQRHERALSIKWNLIDAEHINIGTQFNYGSPYYQGTSKDTVRAQLLLNQQKQNYSWNWQYQFSYSNLDKRAQTLAPKSYLSSAAYTYTFSPKLQAHLGTTFTRQTDRLEQNENDYLKTTLTSDINYQLNKELSLRLKKGIERYTLLTTHTRLFPLGHKELSFNYAPSSIYNFTCGYQSKYQVSNASAKKEHTYRFSGGLKPFTSTSMQLGYSKHLSNSQTRKQLFTSINYNPKGKWQGSLRFNGSKAANGSKTYNGQFSLQRAFQAPIITPRYSKKLNVNITLDDYPQNHPFYLQIGSKTVKVSKSGKYTFNVNQGNLSVNTWKLDDRFTLALPLDSVFIPNETSPAPLHLEIVQAAKLKINLLIANNISDNMIDIETELQLLHDFLKKTPLVLRHSESNHHYYSYKHQDSSYQFNHLPPGQYEVVLPEGLDKNIYFQLANQTIILEKGSSTDLDLHLKSRKRRLKLL